MIEPPVDIAILVFPENSASVVYGLYDLFLSAGRVWGHHGGKARSGTHPPHGWSPGTVNHSSE
jgi:hypothetical protein